MTIPTTLGEAWSLYGGLLIDIAVFFAVLAGVYIVGNFLLLRVVSSWVKSRGLDKTIHSVAEKITHVLVGFAALATAMTAAGFPSFLTAFATLGGALALAIGFASQDLISNFVSGLFILKDKPFKHGDWIEWDGNSGVVEEIDLRVTRVKTFDNELITVPNGDLANNAVKNPVAYDRLRQKFVFGIGYGDDIDEAIKIIQEEAEEHEGIMDEPAPSVRMVEMGDNAIGLQSRIWIEDPKRSDFVKTKSEYIQAVKERFDDAGIDMPYPQVELSGSINVD